MFLAKIISLAAAPTRVTGEIRRPKTKLEPLALGQVIRELERLLNTSADDICKNGEPDAKALYLKQRNAATDAITGADALDPQCDEITLEEHLILLQVVARLIRRGEIDEKSYAVITTQMYRYLRLEQKSEHELIFEAAIDVLRATGDPDGDISERIIAIREGSREGGPSTRPIRPSRQTPIPDPETRS